MADANGSYDAKNAIELGKRLQEMKYLWFEEPCPWGELSETGHGTRIRPGFRQRRHGSETYVRRRPEAPGSKASGGDGSARGSAH
ncbi:MAG: enolase C-terminal domain-like protein [Bryobacteraceae bacterium]